MKSRLHSLVLLLWVLLAGFSVLETSSLAHARDKKEEDPAALRMARKRFREGVRFFDTKQYAKARAAFLQAYALKKHSTVLLNLAQSELRSGYEADAARHFAQYFRETEDATAAQMKKAEQGLGKAKAKVAEVVLAVDVDDAYVLVDGVLLGRSPLPDPLYLSPGTHVVGVRKGGTSVTRQVTAIPGESFTEMVNVTAPPPIPQAAGPVPGVDEERDEYQGVGREPFFRWLGRKPGALIGAGVTLIGTATATVFVISWQTNRSAAEDTRNKILVTYASEPPTSPVASNRDDGIGPCVNPIEGYVNACSDYLAYKDTADNHRTIALVGGSIALLALAGTISAYFIDARKGTGVAQRPEGVRLKLLPQATLETQGLSLVGTF